MTGKIRIGQFWECIRLPLITKIMARDLQYDVWVYRVIYRGDDMLQFQEWQVGHYCKIYGPDLCLRWNLKAHHG